MKEQPEAALPGVLEMNLASIGNRRDENKTLSIGTTVIIRPQYPDQPERQGIITKVCPLKSISIPEQREPVPWQCYEVEADGQIRRYYESWLKVKA